MKIVKIGCCGFPSGRSKYYKEYSVVELQNTFYDLPSTDWARKVRSEAPPDFEFVIKVWQVITHPPTSPTWRKLKKKPQGSLENYGFLKPTNENIKALEKVVEIADILGSRILVFQTPASMPYSDESIKWVIEFFEKAREIVGDKYVLAWEPRGEWNNHDDVLKEIMSKHNIVHVTDVFKRKPVHMADNVFYTRLHGIGPREVNYRYKYTDEDFAKLSSILKELDFKQGYVMFNNVYMGEDSKRFKKYLLEKHGNAFKVT